MNTGQEGLYSFFDSSISIRSQASCRKSTLQYYFQKNLKIGKTPQNDFSENSLIAPAIFHYLNLFLVEKMFDVKGVKMELECFSVGHCVAMSRLTINIFQQLFSSKLDSQTKPQRREEVLWINLIYWGLYFSYIEVVLLIYWGDTNKHCDYDVITM